MVDHVSERYHVSSRNRAKSLKTLTQKLGLVFGGLLIGFIIVEIALVLLGVSYPRVTQTDYYRGRSYRPGAEWEHSKKAERESR